jgi:hypothetical protein
MNQSSFGHNYHRGYYELNLIVLARRVIVTIPAHSTITSIAEHVLPPTLIVQSNILISAPHSNWIVTSLSTIEIPERFTITVSGRVGSVEPLSVAVAPAGDTGGVLYGAVGAEEANTVVVTGSVSLLILYAR